MSIKLKNSKKYIYKFIIKKKKVLAVQLGV